MWVFVIFCHLCYQSSSVKVYVYFLIKNKTIWTMLYLRVFFYSYEDFLFWLWSLSRFIVSLIPSKSIVYNAGTAYVVCLILWESQFLCLYFSFCNHMNTLINDKITLNLFIWHYFLLNYQTIIVCSLYIMLN